MKTIRLTKGKRAIVDDSDYENINKYNWQAVEKSGKWRAMRSVQINKHRKIHFSMHRQILGLEYMDGRMVDHINSDTLDNRRENLRLCTPSQNCQNQQKRRNCVSKYKGITKQKETNKWRAWITKDYKRIELGYFDTEEKAAKAYNTAAIKYFGEFAKLNEV